MVTVICSYCQYVGQGKDYWEKCSDVEKHEETCVERYNIEYDMSLTDVAKELKDEDARKILEHPENFPDDWVENAKERLKDGL